MAELIPQERLQPALLDRLTDDEPDTKVESREKRVISVRRLRESVLRDLAWLLNTTPLGQTEDLAAYPNARQSTLDYGLPDLAGVTFSGLDPGELERRIKDAIRRFEPRVAAKSLRVHAVLPDDSEHRNALAFEIEGELWGQPLPTALYLRSEIDLEDGSLTVTEHALPGQG